MWQRCLIPARTSSKFSKYFRGKRSSFIHRQTGGWMVFWQKKIGSPVFICLNTQPRQMVATYQCGLNANKFALQVFQFNEFCRWHGRMRGGKGGWSKEGVKQGSGNPKGESIFANPQTIKDTGGTISLLWCSWQWLWAVLNLPKEQSIEYFANSNKKPSQR